MGKIKEIVIGADYQVTVRFDNSHSVTIDMSTRLHTARFSELRTGRCLTRRAPTAKRYIGRAEYQLPSARLWKSSQNKRNPNKEV